MTKQKICRRFLVIGLVTIIGHTCSIAQQVSDENFHYPLASPMYKEAGGPLILFDEAHNNPATLKGAYSAFGRLLLEDGYNVASTKENLSLDLLERAKIFVTVNAMYDMENWNLPARSAFSAQEINALSSWVDNGGSLFLITDHMPCGASVNDLAGRFGINIINGFALRNDGLPEVFSRERKTLIANEITDPPGKAVDSIMCWGGTGFILPSNAQAISVLDDNYRIYLPSDVQQIKRPLPDTLPYISGRGLANGAYLKFGKGRIVIFGDGAPFSAQLQGIKSEKRGMNHPGAAQNVQLLLNIVHWLDRRL